MISVYSVRTFFNPLTLVFRGSYQAYTGNKKYQSEYSKRHQDLYIGWSGWAIDEYDRGIKQRTNAEDG